MGAITPRADAYFLMQLHVFQHIPHEDESNIRAWCSDRGHKLGRTRFYASDPFPALADIDALVIMGGFMNVYEYDCYPWLYHEKTFILDAIGAGLPVLGICLGAQLVADVMGGRVRRNDQAEIGWHPVELTPEALAMPIFRPWPPEMTVLHWHNDTFDLPAGATRIAQSQACGNQGFVIGERVVGLQFHMEYSQEDLRAMVEGNPDEASTGPYVQPAADILSDVSGFNSLRRHLFAFLDGFLV